jgi:hypothetical protein
MVHPLFLCAEKRMFTRQIRMIHRKKPCAYARNKKKGISSNKYVCGDVFFVIVFRRVSVFFFRVDDCARACVHSKVKQTSILQYLVCITCARECAPKEHTNEFNVSLLVHEHVHVWAKAIIAVFSLAKGQCMGPCELGYARAPRMMCSLHVHSACISWKI